jgi:hypothetical protein
MPNPTSAQARVKSQRAATKGVNWYITDDATKPLNEWRKLENQKAMVVFLDLVPGVEYAIVAELLGPRGQRQLSPKASVIA